MQHTHRDDTPVPVDTWQVSRIETIPGREPVIAVAPHGFQGDVRRDLRANDEKTGDLARELATRFGWYAVINEKYKKTGKGQQPDVARGIVNLNSLAQVETHVKDEFLGRILAFKEEIVSAHGRLMVVHLHGIGRRSIETYLETHGGEPATSIFIGFGQALPGLERLTADEPTVDRFIRHLARDRDHPLHAVKTDPEYRNYRGWSTDNLNQLFRRHPYRDERVRSMQLELAYTGVRDDEHLIATAQTFAHSMQTLSAGPPG